MKIIRQIFRDDVRQLSHHFLALVIAIGVCFLSPLYAWCNIYSNWDPYGNTGNLKMAVVSLDEGFTDSDGIYHNNGSEIIDNLHENDKINWQFVGSKEEAVEGVRDGSYYGAIVIAEDFSYNMYNIFLEDAERPKIAFYQNQKKNPVANKITDTVVEALKTQINDQFVKAMATTVFRDATDMNSRIQKDGGVDGVIRQMQQLDQLIRSYQGTISVALQGNQTLADAIQAADEDVTRMQSDTQHAGDDITKASDSIAEAQVTLDTYASQVNQALDQVDAALSGISEGLREASVSGDASQMREAARSSVEQIKVIDSNLDALVVAAGGHAIDLPQGPIARKTMEAAQDAIEKVRRDVDDASALAQDVRDQKASDVDTLIAKVESAQNTFNNSLRPQISSVLSDLSSTVNDAGNLMYSLSDTLAGMGSVFDALQVTVNAGDNSLNSTNRALDLIAGRLEETIAKVNEAKNDEKVKALINTLTGDPTRFGDFFSSPVKIDSTAIYPVENYGSSVTPFYTTLAIWVGGLLLTAILKTRPDPAKYPGAKNYQLYFGRFATFFVLGQVSTLITVIGNLCLLKVQCLYPFQFWLACAIASFTFTLLIYSLVYAFLDVGKAIAVVIVVLQIAGSSGTYPIELLPPFFKAVYRFFPFPYAINAMRECIGGMYGSDYALYLIELSGFILVSLVIGIWIKIPFHGIMSFMEKRMEDTEML